MPRITPLHNNLIVEEHQLGQVSKGGILLPDIGKASTPYRFATVLEVGPGRIAADGHLVPCSCKQGDTIAFAKSAGIEFPLEDDEGKERVLKILNEQYVLGVMHDLPVVSRLSGLDGRLLTMNPSSRAASDIAVEQGDKIARARREGIIDSAGGTLDAMVDADRMDMESEA
jgi:co-chaperonin GroES (HSP10)